MAPVNSGPGIASSADTLPISLACDRETIKYMEAAEGQGRHEQSDRAGVRLQRGDIAHEQRERAGDQERTAEPPDLFLRKEADGAHGDAVAEHPERIDLICQAM